MSMGFHFACLLVLANVLNVRAAMVSLLVAVLVSLPGCFLITEASSDNETFTMVCGTDDKQFVPATRAHDTNAVFNWPQGRIPYRFEGAVTYNDRQLIRRAMKQIEAQTCIRYNEDQSPPRHYLRILVGSPSCRSGFFGWVDYRSEVVTLASSWQLADLSHCSSYTEGGIVHELMHALGVQHTQKRSDRDTYIKVNTENIQQNYVSQYSPPCYTCNNHGVPYDCSSIMHYGTQSLSNGRDPTMTPKVSGCNIARQMPSVATRNDWDMLREVAKDQCGGVTGCSYTDTYPTYCPYWKNKGYCASGPYVAWMATYCAKTCKCGATFCQHTDKYPNQCPGWKNPYCTTGAYVAWMAQNCAKTCKC